MRNITPEMAEEYASPSVSPVMMAEMFFDDGTLRLWSGLGDLTWGDKTFTGGGGFIGISPIEETQDNQAKGVVATLNGVPSNYISLALSERCRGRKFVLYLAAATSQRFVSTEDGGIVRTEDGGRVLLENNLVDSPYRIFSGLMDTMEITDDGSTANIRLSVENALIIGQRPKIRRYTAEDQKKFFPNDQGLDFINQLIDKEVVW